jgi:hypothetical protein
LWYEGATSIEFREVAGRSLGAVEQQLLWPFFEDTMMTTGRTGDLLVAMMTTVVVVGSSNAV